MADLENDTDEGVNYSVEEGQGTGTVLYRPLEPRQVVSLPITTMEFDIRFYKRGEKELPLVFRRSISGDSLVRLRRAVRDRWEIEVHPAKEVALA